ncbi:MAG: HAD-IC family P-type ATPase [Candidatus Pacearchaeota archaeon]|nr:HAD-IC family P-type ATPase [Candidatus Pacearchaeota archaeon]
MTTWHAIDKKEVLEILKTSEKGLSEKEAEERLKKYGYNEIKQVLKINPIKIFLQQFNSIFVYILLLAAIFSLLIKHYVDFSVIFAIIIINSSIGFFQQYKAEKTILEMKKLLVSKVRVLRNNVLKEISSFEIVPGDILFVSEGDKIMADCRVIYENELETNEAILTGESFPVKKTTEKVPLESGIFERKNIVFMGTSIVKGSAHLVVVSTGMSTEFGKVASLVQEVQPEKTPLEKKIDGFSKNVALIISILTIITIFVGLLRGEEIFNMFLTGIALAVSVIPEGLPAVIAITLALAIGRMKTQNALIRTLPAAETLGRTTVICVDKTGTITEEEMVVTKLYCGKKFYEIKDEKFFSDNKKIIPLKNQDIKTLLKVGIMCNNARIENIDGKIKIIGDSTERALVLSAEKAGLSKKETTEKEERIYEFSFSSKRKLMSIIRESDRRLISYLKGAPDIIIERCTKEIVNGEIIPLTTNRKKELLSISNEMSSQALRVLAFAFRYVPEKFTQEIAEHGLIFVGFQGIIDPPRKEVKKAIEECKTAGIKVKMFTGDSLLTAEAISNMIGLDGGSIDGKELEKLSEEEFNKAVITKNIFARITPEIKLKIIKTLKQQKEIVAVTGDGVNDVLALKEAHIGVAMGMRGSDVAREVSDIILLDDNFNSIVKAIKEGRRVYDNLEKSIKFHLSANFGELLLVLFAMILAMPLPMLPLAILWMNLITDSLPSLSLSVEKEEENLMKRKPKNPEETILKDIWKFVITAGLITFIVVLILFFVYYQTNLQKARTIALTTAVFSELFLLFTCRSKDKNIWEIGIFSNKFALYSVIGAAILQCIAIYSPLSTIFGIEKLAISELLMAIIVSSSAFIFFEIKKFVNRKSINQ